MNNTEKLYAVVATALQIAQERVTDDLAYNTVPEWDSVAHMALVAEIEGAFDVMLDTDDIIGMESVCKAREILARHQVSF